MKAINLALVGGFLGFRKGPGKNFSILGEVSLKIEKEASSVLFAVGWLLSAGHFDRSYRYVHHPSCCRRTDATQLATLSQGIPDPPTTK